VPTEPSTRVQNKLLSGLRRSDRLALVRRCEPVELVFGQILCETGEPLQHAHFPLTGIVSVLATTGDRPPLEMGLIGNEGMLGVTLALGVDTAPMLGVVQGNGSALRISRAHLRRELSASATLRHTLERYLYVVLSQLAISAACTHFHETAPRLARWLLMTHDRAHADRFHLTHAILADMMGVRRSSVSVAAAAMQRDKLIAYTRGEITVLDRRRLERSACACYAAEKADYARIFGATKLAPRVAAQVSERGERVRSARS
jgi:CRP-like cAMP-binding protein